MCRRGSISSLAVECGRASSCCSSPRDVPHQPTQCADIGPPLRHRAFTAVDFTLGLAQRVCYQRVVQGPKDQRPCQPSETALAHVETVAQDAVAWTSRDDFELVSAVEAGGAVEGKANIAARCGSPLRGSGWGRAPLCAVLQRPIEAHGWPALVGPKLILRARQRVEQRSHLRRGAIDGLFVDVCYSDRGLPN